MQTVSLKSNTPETAIPLVMSAIEREKRIISESIRLAKKKIERLAKDIVVDVDKLIRGEVEHTEANDMQLIELEGEIEIMKHHECELKELESVEICR